jgi:glycine/D-amino acid oxidase-like deaminating enzyme
MKLSNAGAVVIGGGLIGAASAYYLARLGVDVELIERNGIGTATSSACADVLAHHTKAPGPKLLLATESVRMYHGLSEELDCDLEFRNEGSMVAALSEAEAEYLGGLVDRLRTAGIPAELLDSQAAREAQPALTPGLIAASYCSLDCHVSPLLVSMAFAAAAARLGARIRTETEVTGIEVQGSRVRAVMTSRGRIDTPVAIDAAGVWSPAVARMVGLDLAVVPRKGQILVTEAVPPMLRGRMLTARYLMGKHAQGDYAAGVSMGQTPRGNFIIGSTREFAGFDTSHTFRGVSDLMNQTVELLPALANVRLLRSFAGLRPATPEGLPVIKRYSEIEGFIVASGHEGDGICLAPVTGRIVADIVAGRIDDYSQFLAALTPSVEPR